MPNDLIMGFDPGHGGNNDGAWTPSGHTREADLTLPVGYAVKSLYPETVLTRCDDTTISYEARARMADAFSVDLMICGHFNSWTDPRRRGLRAFYFRGNGITRKLARHASIHAPPELGPGRVICAQSEEGTDGTDYLTSIYPMDCLVIEFGFLSNDRDRKFCISTDGISACAELVVSCFEEYKFIKQGRPNDGES